MYRTFTRMYDTYFYILHTLCTILANYGIFLKVLAAF